mmetsp:Transcript_84271/g.212492  ORF Transcript_84271/g.212492 Transcript_84271/m.212492 type:complete len:239 (-) Transcript_84271:259-975(-)
MFSRICAVAAGFAVCQACSPLTYLKPSRVRNFMPGAVAADSEGEITLQLSCCGSPASPGLVLQDASGKQVGSGACQPGDQGLVCKIPALAAGSYTMAFSEDVSCGAKSYGTVADRLEVAEAAHVVSLSPSHGPPDAQTTVTVMGKNIVGSHVTCALRFFGMCDLNKKWDGAIDVTPTSAKCILPPRPKPVGQPDGHGGFKPVPGAPCSGDVQVQIYNGEVLSPDSILYHYDDATQVVV